MRESNTHWIGWNPASNSEGGESFVVGEVQGRRGPLITKDEVCAQVEVVKTQPQIQREERVLDLRTASDNPKTETLSTRSGCGVENIRLRQRLGQHFLELARWIGPGGPSAWGGKGRTRLVSDVLAATRERVCRIYKLGVLDNPS